MLIVPIGHDQSVYGRSWLTWILIAINVIAFALSALVAHGARADIYAAMTKVRRVHSEYPDARIPPGIVESLPFHIRLNVAGLVSDDPEDLEEPGARTLKRAAKRLAAEVESVPNLRFGYRPGKPSAIGVVTSLFMHSDIYHLLGNMLFLWLAGRVIECFWEARAFLILYFVAGAAGTLGHHLANPDSMIPLIGASGAIAGLLGAFVVGHPRTRIKMLYALWAFRPYLGTFDVPAWLLIPLWFALQLGFALLFKGDGVAYWAHVGGFAAGIAGALIMRWGGWLIYDAEVVLEKKR